MSVLEAATLRYREVQRAWTRFDRSTAFGCANRNEPFDAQRCEEIRVWYFGILDAHEHWLRANWGDLQQARKLQQQERERKPQRGGK